MSSEVETKEQRHSGDPAGAATARDDPWARTYTYVRLAIAFLLIALGVAVFYQSWRQDWTFLASVSAYYYTPAQAIFVGALIGMGVGMIAIRGWNATEEIFLNLGGMFALLVAIVPTSRGADYEAARDACRAGAGPVTTTTASSSLDCPKTEELEAATSANVENNTVALLFVGFLGLGLALLVARRNPRFKLGFGAAASIWLVGAVVRVFWPQLLIDHAHFVAASLLLVCVAVVAAANALRRDVDPAGGDGRQPDQVQLQHGAAFGTPDRRHGARSGHGPNATSTTVRLERSMPADMATPPTKLPIGLAPLARDPRRFDRYAWLAWSIVLVALVGSLLVATHVVSLFLVEIAVAALFVGFWLVQTFEQRPAGFGR